MLAYTFSIYNFYRPKKLFDNEKYRLNFVTYKLQMNGFINKLCSFG